MTTEDHDAIVHELLDCDPDFQRLHEEHQQCEGRLEELQSMSLLAEADEIEEKKIKIRKLALKDRMEQIVREHESLRVTA